ncbi:MAG: TetR/AcrR family transcriptional regulator [Clostridia bacterium]|nr:TetR/AcrR family transcriptional regulator [Clostridia bacterium]
MRRADPKTKSKIISAAWRLFYDQGYDNTTVEDIVSASLTSKGTFYHYFDGKDALLGTLSTLFDDKYSELVPHLSEIESSFDRLIFLNAELFGMIERSISVELLSKLLSTQLLVKGERHLLDRDRLYFKLLEKTVREGQSAGELRSDISSSEIVKAYALAERAFMYDWCLCSGEYSLKSYACPVFHAFLSTYLNRS